MISLGSVSKRTKAIYERYYEDREAQRFANLYSIFTKLAANVEAGNLDAKLEIDYLRLAEIVRSYFFDVIRYKEYHFNPEDEDVEGLLKTFGKLSLAEVDPLSPEWTELVHRTANINSSKVAAYCVKWILRYKPISVISTKRTVGNIYVPGVQSVIGGPNSFLSNINELFALHTALVALEIDAVSIPQRKLDELIYSFRFRSYDEAAHFSILSKDYLCAAGLE
jgi:hypothetical protein